MIDVGYVVLNVDLVVNSVLKILLKTRGTRKRILKIFGNRMDTYRFLKCLPLNEFFDPGSTKSDLSTTKSLRLEPKLLFEAYAPSVLKD